WKISNCSHPGSFIASAQRALYAWASSGPFPGTALIVTTSRIDMMAPLCRLALRLQPVDVDALTGNVARLVGGEKRDGVGLVLRLPEAPERHAAAERRPVPLELRLPPRRPPARRRRPAA